MYIQLGGMWSSSSSCCSLIIALFSNIIFISPYFVFRSLHHQIEHFMEVTRRMRSVNVADVRPPLRQNTFVVEDRNVMRLGGEEDCRTGLAQEKNGRTNGTKKVVQMKPPTTTRTTSKTNSGLGDGECPRL